MISRMNSSFRRPETSALFFRAALVAMVAVCAGTPATAQPGSTKILDSRERAEAIDRILEKRLDTVVPALMDREQVDVWVVAAREYNEDPVIRSMLPATWLAARRRTILLFRRTAIGEIERLAVARYDIGSLFRGAWDPESQPDQWAHLAGLIEEVAPNNIAVNVSPTFALADGLTQSEYDAFRRALPEGLRGRVISGERLAIGWLETRIAEEMEIYPSIVRIARQIIEDGLSDAVIQPGVTTTADVEWWYRDRVLELGLETWFHPTVSIQRADAVSRDEDFSAREAPDVIRRGDLVHVDFGITYLRLNTDTQQHAYVLRRGEDSAPAGLEAALSIGNRLQDILTAEFRQGRTGNEILAAALERARAERIAATIYTHPIGFHGHGAGPTIGLWDQQEGVPGRGDYPLYANTAHSIELNAAVPVPEWGNKKVRIMLEEDAFFDGSSTWYIDGRQTQLLLVR